MNTTTITMYAEKEPTGISMNKILDLEDEIGVKIDVVLAPKFRGKYGLYRIKGSDRNVRIARRLLQQLFASHGGMIRLA